MQRVLDQRLHRLVVLGEWAVDHRRGEEAADALAIHDEREPGLGVFRVHRRRIVGHVTDPLLLGGIPFDAGPSCVPGTPVQVRRCPVVEDPPVQRPGPGPGWIEPHARRVILCRVLDAVAALHQVACIRIAAGVDPVAGGRAAVALEEGEARHLLAGGEVGAVDLLRDLVQGGLSRLGVTRYGQRHDRIRELAALLLVELLHPVEEIGQDPVVVAGVALGRDDLVLPL